VKDNTTVTIQAKGLPLRQFLDVLLKDQQMDYTIRSKTIFLSRKTDAGPAQQAGAIPDAPPPVFVSVVGVVTAEDGQALEGATVTIRRTKRSTVTGSNGQFSLSANIGDILVITYVNYYSQEITVKSPPASDRPLVLNIVMKPAIANLNQTVVNGIYRRPVENYTGAAQTYTIEQLRTVSNTNVLSALRSLDASFQMPSDITFGSDPNHLPQIQVRGANSIANTDLTSQYGYVSNPPLFILDGFEVPLQTIYDLDMNRISKLTILKDAAATAIYGSKAANGVLVIETVQPKKGRLRLSYNNNLSVSTPDLTSYHLLNSSQKLQLEKAAGIYNTTPQFGIRGQEVLDEIFNHRLTEEKRGVNTYWLSRPLATEFSQKHSLYVDGGDDYMRYGVDLSYSKNGGVMKGSKRDNLAGGIHLIYHKDKLQFTNYLSVIYNNSVSSPYGSFSQYALLNPYLRPKDSITGGVPKILENAYDEIIWPTVVYNPMYDATLKTQNKTGYLRVADNFQADWNIKESLKLSTRFSMYSQKNTGDVFLPADAVEFVNTPDSLFSTRGYYQQMTGQSTSYQADVFLNYGQTFGRHTIFATAGSHVQQDKSYTNTVTVQGFPNSTMDDILFGLQYPVNDKPAGSENIARLISYYANISYAYDYRYLLDLSFRRDGSSLFGTNQHYAPFWSVGAGWNIHKEKFIDLPKLINRFKLRASYGSTGSQNFPAFAASQTYSYLTGFRYLNNIGATMISLGNNNLKWQQTNKANAGADIELFNGRIQATFNYYVEKTDNLFTSVNTTPSSGFSSYYANLGRVQNKGYEVYLTTFLMKNERENIFWSFYANVLHNENKLLKISDALKAQNDKAVDQQVRADNPITAPVLQYKEGQSVSTIYAVRSLGIDPSTGNEIFLTRDGQQTYRWSPLDEVPVGDNQPKVTGNLGTNFMYKGASVNVSMRTELGGQMYNSTLANMVENANPYYNVDIRVLTDRWQKPGDVASYKGLAAVDGTTRTDITKASSRFIQKNNTLYCDAITLGYLFPSRLTNRWKMSRLQCYLYINNPFVVSSIKQERGLDYPFARNYSFSLQLGF
jgi:TonB-linked SusC/RagA family outer membrane protein